MQAVLGIDAAWTATHPSGVALAVECGGVWQLTAVASSYEDFRLGDVKGIGGSAISHLPDPTVLLTCAEAICGGPVSVVAVDMPLARQAIVGRRRCDNAVSQAFARQKCGTYSPSALRPGAISDQLRAGFGRAGYPLRTTTFATPGLIEVYPHPALLALCGASERVPYKSAKVRKYWPLLSPAERRAQLYRQWSEIVVQLDREITGAAAKLPPPCADASSIVVKAYEDMLDAVICAWIGVCVLQGRAERLGDDDAAIWIPVGNVIAPVAERGRGLTPV